MAVKKDVEYSGNRITSSGNGRMILDETNGEILIRDPQNIRRYYLGSRKSPTGFGQYLSKDGEDVMDELEA